MEVSVLKRRIINDLEELPPAKVSEVVDFVEYLKTRKESWKSRFKSLFKKIEPKIKKISYAAIKKEISKTRGR